MANTNTPTLREKHIKEFFIHFDKTVTYIHSHSLNDERGMLLVDELYSVLVNYIMRYGEFEIGIKPYQMLIDDSVVYENNQPDNSHAFRWFRNGLRVIKFKSNLTLDEFRRFIQIDSTDYTDSRYKDDNMMALMWEAAFDHIDTITTVLYDELLSHEDQEVLRQMNIIMANFDQATLSTVSDYEDLTESQLSSLQTDSSEIFHPGDNVRIGELTEEERQLTAKLVENPTPQLMLRLIQSVFILFKEESDEKPIRQLLNVLRDVIVVLLKSAKIKWVVSIFENLDHFEKEVVSKDSRKQAMVSELYSTVLTEEVVAQFLLNLGSNPAFSRDHLYQLMSLMVQYEHNLEPILKNIYLIHNDIIRHDIVSLISPIVAQHMNVISDIVSTETNEKSLIVLIHILMSLESDDANQVIAKLKNHKSSTIRESVMKACQGSESSFMINVLFSGAMDTEKDVRLAALNQIAMIADESLNERLIDMMLSSSFHLRDVEEKEICLRILAQTESGRRAICGLLQDTNIVASRKAKETGMLLPTILAESGDGSDLRVLKKCATGLFVSKHIKQACMAAIAQIEEKVHNV